MGTDISIYAERRAQGMWLPVPEPEINSGDKTPVEALDIGQPYALFSLLAGSDIGMMATLAEMPRHFTPRGFPSDMCELYTRELPKWFHAEGGSGPSWLNVRELEEVDWELPVRMRSFVESEYAELFVPNGPFPELFPKDAKLYHNLFMKPPESTREVKWAISLREHVGCAEWFIGSLRTLAAEGELRIIYWFN